VICPPGLAGHQAIVPNARSGSLLPAHMRIRRVDGRLNEPTTSYATDMVPTTHLLAFTITAVVLIASPGPSVLFVVSRSIVLGRAAGVATVAGNTIVLGAIFAIVLGAIFAGIALISDSTRALVAGTVRAWLAGSPRRLALLGGTGGLAMITIGTRLALSGRQD
jgi:threonine/homoserine/homoserine lactone efflux protein